MERGSTAKVTLRKVIEFIRAGGMDKARAREIADLEQQRSLSKIAQIGGASEPLFPTATPRYDGYDVAFSLVGEALKFLLEVVEREGGTGRLSIEFSGW